ncbi:MAG: phospholipase [Gaiellaceae bacterium]|jgi:phospholipase/carboxylesterase
MGLVILERAAAGEAIGALVLFHGRGSDEGQLVELFDLLDPERHLLGLAPRAPHPQGQDARWYTVERAGFPERSSFLNSCRLASEWLDALGFAPGRIVLGGFSQGATMSYALGLGAGRHRPAALIALSGYLPAVDGWEIDLSAPLPRVAIGHGALDDVIPVEFARAARSRLERAGTELLYRESPLGHSIDPAFVGEVAAWLKQAL